MLALRYPFRGKSISLVGSSLGAKVIKSCLKTLKEHGEVSLIDEVTFFGGATQIDKPDWLEVFSKVVQGQIWNCYTKTDFLLTKVYRNSQHNNPIGVQTVFMKSTSNKLVLNE